MLKNKIMENTQKKLAPLYAMVFITTCSIYFIIPLLGPMLLQPNNSSILPMNTSDYSRHLYYGTILTLPQIFMFIGPPIWGALSDIFGRKALLIFALFGVGISLIISIIGIINHLIIFLILGSAFLGVSDASDALAQAAVIDVSAKKDKTKNISLMNFFSSLGLIIGPLLGGFFSDKNIFFYFRFETPYVIAIVLVILNIIGLLFFYKEPHNKKNEIKSSAIKHVLDFAFIFKSSHLKKLVLIFFLMEIDLALFYQSISRILAEKFHYSPYVMGIYFATLSVSICLTYVFFIPLLIKYFSKINIIAFAFFLLTLIGITLSINNSKLIIWSVAIFLSISIALIYSLTITLISDKTDESHQGKIMGVTMATVALSFMIAGGIIGSGIRLKYIFILFSLFSVLGFTKALNFYKKGEYVNEK